ncbi:hypothetical protein C8Q80DRAFT_918156 [Daedaleopsis nitida]|nr:hypothetical protein C8Q80DRAFT_918156 [Daedaleopsis nitida]
MPSAIELRNKAAKMADAGTTKISNTRDRMTSQPSKNINWDAEVKAKPPPLRPQKMPPPPSRTTSSPSSSSPTSQAPSKPPVPLRKTGSSVAPSLAGLSSQVSHSSSVSAATPLGPPPVVRRETRPDAVPTVTAAPPRPPPARSAVSVPRTTAQPQNTQEADIDHVDWTNLSPEDKETFFGWLDEFFGRYLQVSVPPRSATPAKTLQHVKVPPGGHTPPPMTGLPKPPTVTRPRPPPRPSSDPNHSEMSYPPPVEHGSAAEDLAHYFHPSTHWDSAWYAIENEYKAPPLRGNDRISFTASWQSDGRTKTLYGGVLFCDLSMCWYSVAWPVHAAPSHDPNDAHSVRRSAQYLPRPGPWLRERLFDAHETYGETVAAYAESYEGTGTPCARGECWDLAHEALKYFEQYDYVPKPVPSISRTHGHLIYEGRAANKGRTQSGRWRGGDDRVRRGDIVEWREARVGMGPHAWGILGNPDHTAVIVCDMVPKTGVGDGMAVLPAQMGTLEVVEQSLGKPPARARYDLAQFEEGEVWIYRPVGMEEYVGALLGPTCPPGVNALSV